MVAYALLDRSDFMTVNQAAFARDLVSVRNMLDRGYGVDSIGPDGFILLQIASATAQYDLLELLVDRGADVNREDRDGMTALFCCADINMLNHLLRLGATPTHRNLAGQNALDYFLSEGGDSEIIARLRVLDTSSTGMLFERLEYCWFCKLINYGKDKHMKRAS